MVLSVFIFQLLEDNFYSGLKYQVSLVSRDNKLDQQANISIQLKVQLSLTDGEESDHVQLSLISSTWQSSGFAS